VPATSTTSSKAFSPFLLQPLTVLMKQTRQAVCAIKQSILLICLWDKHWYLMIRTKHRYLMIGVKHTYLMIRVKHRYLMISVEHSYHLSSVLIDACETLVSAIECLPVSLSLCLNVGQSFFLFRSVFVCLLSYPSMFICQSLRSLNVRLSVYV